MIPDFSDLKGQPVGLATAVAISRLAQWMDVRLSAIEAKVDSIIAYQPIPGYKGPLIPDVTDGSNEMAKEKL